VQYSRRCDKTCHSWHPGVLIRRKEIIATLWQSLQSPEESTKCLPCRFGIYI